MQWSQGTAAQKPSDSICWHNIFLCTAAFKDMVMSAWKDKKNRKTNASAYLGIPQLYDFQGWKPEGGGVMLWTKPWHPHMTDWHSHWTISIEEDTTPITTKVPGTSISCDSRMYQCYTKNILMICGTDCWYDLNRSVL